MCNRLRNLRIGKYAPELHIMSDTPRHHVPANMKMEKEKMKKLHWITPQGADPPENSTDTSHKSYMTR